MDGNEEILQEFVTESRESLDEIEPVLIALESSGDAEHLNLIFRCFHSFKGTASFLGLSVIAELAHAAESLLDLMRKGECRAQKAHVDVLCQTLDEFREILDAVDTTQSDSSNEASARTLASRLLRLVSEVRGSASARGDVARSGLEAMQSQAVQAMNPVDSPPSSLPYIDLTSDSETGGGDMDITEELLIRFVTESEEHFGIVEETLVALEAGRADTEQLAEAFRAVHSFKGNAAICGLNEMSALVHHAETVFDGFQAGRLMPTPDMITRLLGLLDVLREALNDLPGGTARIRDFAFWEAQLTRMSADAGGSARGGASRANAPGEPTSSTGPSTHATAPAAASREKAAGSKPFAGGEASRTGGPPRNATRTVGSIRVDTSKLDELMNLVGELIIAETTVTRNPDLEGHDFENFQKAALNLNRITRSLQDIAMAVRMIPIATTFRKMIRLVRDVAGKQEKNVELATFGEDTEIDKTVIESISDPLVHIIRNAVDHGIESAAERKQIGKPPQGRVVLEARHQGGEVWIVVRDDGKGLNPETLLNKAIEKKLADPTRKYADREIFDFIFAPGFSTASTVTDISGRGVGMDVVRRNIEAVGGRVEVSSKLGEGTMFTLRIPLTLAIIEGMLVRVGGSYYTIPLLSIRESVRPHKKDVLCTSDGYEMLRLRNRHYPIVRLERLHHIDGGLEDLFDGTLVIVESLDGVSCILVDEVLGQCQTVIKPLPDYLKRVRGLSGCSILHNGEISLILDVEGVVAHGTARAA